MRRLVRISLALVVLLVLALVAATITVVTSVRKSFPDEEGALALPGLSAPVEVRRDQWGVPQIYADTSADLFFAQGFVHAQDRFFEMDFRRHLTAGRLSEWFGEDQLATDKFLRTLGWRETAEREYQKLAPQTKRFLQSYADGVNAYLNGRKGSDISVEYTMGLLGPDDEVKPWEPADSVAWLKAMAWDLRGNLDDEIARTLASTKVSEDRVAELYPDYPYDRNPSIVGDQKAAGEGGSAARTGPAPSGDRGIPADDLYRSKEYSQQLAKVRELIDNVPSPLGGTGGDRSGLGSNSWVVAGSRTTTGKPLLANDPHLAGQIPSIWYQAGLHCRHKSEVCPYDVAGFTFSGFPGVIIGHNDRIAWGFTNLGPDVTDLYLELVDDDSYLYDGQRYPLETRREVILVKGSDPVEFTVRSTRHGPLVSDADSDLAKIGDRAPAGKEAPSGGLATGVALRWTALDAGHTADSVFRLNAAQNWKEFREAAKSFEVPAQNLIYADVDGHIGYQAPGKIPVRKGGTGEWPMPGWSSSYGWVAWVPFDKLPSAYDPPEGFIATANNAVAGKSYPYRLADHYAYGYRAREITDRLRGSEKQNVESMAGIQLDTRNGFAPTLVPYLQRVKGVDAFTRQGLATLKNWDFSQGVDSAPAAYFNAVWDNLLEMTFDDELPPDARPSGGDRWFEVVRRLLADPENKWWDDVRTKDVRETRDAILKSALREARVDVTHELAKDPSRWQWGRLHQLSLSNQTFGKSGIGPLESLFNRGPYEVGGASDAVLATGWNASADTTPDTGSQFAVTALPSMRMVVDLGNFDRSRWVNLTGASGHPWSDHYDDQIPLWLAGETTAWPFSAGAVEKAAPQRLVLRP
ncbi:penicillin acylase family protein [Flindersiella endophytica]